MSIQPIKCASKEYNVTPFYLIQTNGTDKRYVVYLNERVRIRILLAGFINRVADEVLIKLVDLEDKANPVEYTGSNSKKNLHQVMTEFEEFIFQNGFHDFMIRNPETGDYIVFDEHGLIFIYTDDDYEEVLQKLDAEYRPNEKLIYQYDHWHIKPAGYGLEKLMKLVQALGLVKS